MHYFCICFPLVGTDKKQMLRRVHGVPALQHLRALLVDAVFAFPPAPSPHHQTRWPRESAPVKRPKIANNRREKTHS